MVVLDVSTMLLREGRWVACGQSGRGESKEPEWSYRDCHLFYTENVISRTTETHPAYYDWSERMLRMAIQPLCQPLDRLAP